MSLQRTTTIQLRVTRDEKRLIRHAAKLNGLPMSAYLRLAVLNANLRALSGERDEKRARRRKRAV